MKHSQAEQGRTYILRLEDGEILHEQIEKFAKDHRIFRATVSAVGGVDKGSKLVVGPANGRAEEIEPILFELPDVYEAQGTGTLFPGSSGDPVLHMHLSCGRNGECITGCVRTGVKIWHILEVIITELSGTKAVRKKDDATGFELLIP